MFKNKKLTYAILGILLMAVLLIWIAIFSQVPSNLLEVHFFDVGQGDSIFLEMPNGRQVLIDGGPDATVLEKLNQAMPFYDQNIDLIILTHPDNDHLTGLIKVIEHYQISRIVAPTIEAKSAIYQKWQALIKERNIPLTVAQAGQKIIFQPEIAMEILWPEPSFKTKAENTNNASIVSRLVYKETEILLPGDIEKDIEQRLVNQQENLKADVLKIAHHGSKTSTNYNFLKAVNPQIAIISVGAKNSYGHPHQEILDRLKNIRFFRTDKNSDIEIKTDGAVLEVETAK